MKKANAKTEKQTVKIPEGKRVKTVIETATDEEEYRYMPDRMKQMESRMKQLPLEQKEEVRFLLDHGEYDEAFKILMEEEKKANARANKQNTFNE